jgi:hypothetical protein
VDKELTDHFIFLGSQKSAPIFERLCVPNNFHEKGSFAEMYQSQPCVTISINALGTNVAERAQDGLPDITE